MWLHSPAYMLTVHARNLAALCGFIGLVVGFCAGMMVALYSLSP